MWIGPIPSVMSIGLRPFSVIKVVFREFVEVAVSGVVDGIEVSTKGYPLVSGDVGFVVYLYK